MVENTRHHVLHHCTLNVNAQNDPMDFDPLYPAYRAIPALPFASCVARNRIGRGFLVAYACRRSVVH